MVSVQDRQNIIEVLEKVLKRPMRLKRTSREGQSWHRSVRSRRISGDGKCNSSEVHEKASEGSVRSRKKPREDRQSSVKSWRRSVRSKRRSRRPVVSWRKHREDQ